MGGRPAAARYTAGKRQKLRVQLPGRPPSGRKMDGEGDVLFAVRQTGLVAGAHQLHPDGCSCMVSSACST